MLHRPVVMIRSRRLDRGIGNAGLLRERRGAIALDGPMVAGGAVFRGENYFTEAAAFGRQ